VDITVYKASWSPYIGEELPIQHEVNNIHDDFAVAALKNSSTVGHVPWEISRVCWYFPHKSGSEITCSHKLTKDSLYSMHLRRNWARVVNIFQKTFTRGCRGYYNSTIYMQVYIPYSALLWGPNSHTVPQGGQESHTVPQGGQVSYRNKQTCFCLDQLVPKQVS